MFKRSAPDRKVRFLRVAAAAAPLGAILAMLVFGCALAVRGWAASTSDAAVRVLMTRDLAGATGKGVTMETVEYAPGGKSPPHRHDAQVFVYMLEGSVRMQVKGSDPVTLKPGDTFYEGPDDVHLVSENASATKTARFLVVMIKDKSNDPAGHGS